MGKKILRIVTFAAAVGILAGALKLLNWVPLVAQKDLLRKFDNIQEARTELGVREIIVPSYFPQSLSWPPSAILAQKKPYPAVVMEFTRIGTRDTVLVIAQAHSDGFRAEGKIRITDLKERVGHSLKGRDSVLETGFCAKGAACSRVSWKEGEIRIEVMAKTPAFEMLKVAESMLR